MPMITETHVVSGVIQTSVSGNAILTSVSGNSINTSVSGNSINTSISGNSINTSISGNVVQTSISGNNVVINDGATVQTSISGNVVQVVQSRSIQNALSTYIVTQSGIAGNIQLTAAAGGTQLPIIDIGGASSQGGFVFTGMQPYSGATATSANFWIGGGGASGPFFDPNSHPQSNGLLNPVAVRIVSLSPLFAVTDQSGWYLGYFI